MRWIAEAFTPSDGTKDMGVLVDHRAVIKLVEAEPVVYICLNIQAYEVSPAEAKDMVEAMVSGLNATIPAGKRSP